VTDVLQTILLSLRVSGTATLIAVVLGIPFGVLIGLHRFRGRAFVVALIHTGFALPPVVIGLFVFMVLSRNGPAGDWNLLFTLVAAVIAGFGAVISEVGAVMMVGGNIAGETRVMTTAIVLETRRGNFRTAVMLGIVLLLIAFVVNVMLTLAQQRRTRLWS
jgi:tungstate transport system permease protein